MENSASKKQNWIEPEFDKMGMTQWHWRVLHVDRFKLGRNVQIGSFTMIDAQEGVEIQDDVMVGFSCVILSYSSIDGKSGKVILKRGCKVGANSVIMPGVEIGEDAIVGANSFIDKNIPPDELWVGSPARFIKKS
jgi:acetyltransferase-like isoleucine patch superfamily enzyme